MKRILCIVFLLFVLSGCGSGGGGDPPDVTDVPKSPVETPSETPAVSPELPVENPPAEPTPLPKEDPIIVDPVIVDPGEVEEKPQPEPEPEPEPFVFHYTFSGIVEVVSYYNPLNSYFGDLLGETFYGEIHLDARSVYYDTEADFYYIDPPSEDNYIEYFLGDIYFKKIIYRLRRLEENTFLFTSRDEHYPADIVQLPDYVDRWYGQELIRFNIAFGYDGKLGVSFFVLDFAHPSDPLFDTIEMNGEFLEVETQE